MLKLFAIPARLLFRVPKGEKKSSGSTIARELIYVHREIAIRRWRPKRRVGASPISPAPYGMGKPVSGGGWNHVRVGCDGRDCSMEEGSSDESNFAG